MPISDKRARELAELEPPRSMDRIVRFTSELGERLRSRGAGETDAPSSAAGAVAERAQSLAGTIADRNQGIVGGLSASDFRTVAQKHSVTGAEIQEFAKWLARWQEKRTATEAVSAPTLLFVRGAAAVELPGDEAATLSRIAGKRVVRRVVEEEEIVEVVERRVRPRKVARIEEVEEPEARTWVQARQPRLERSRPSEKPQKVEPPVVEVPETQSPRPLYRRALSGLGRSVWTSNVGLAGFMLGALTSRQLETALGSPLGPSPMVSIATMRLADPTTSGALLGPFGGLSPVGALPGALPASELSRIHGASAVPVPTAPSAISLGQAVAPMDATFGVGPELVLRRDAATGGFVIAHLPTGGPLFLPGSVAAALRARYSAPPQLTARGGVTPLMGQVTVVAPPIRVASREMEAGGSALAFDWKQIGLSAGPLDAAGWSAMRQALPPGSQVIYPALPLDSLGPNAVNLRLSQPLLSDLMTRAYGPSAAALAGPASFAAAGAAMSAPASIPLAASIVPLERPKERTASVLGESAALGTLSMAGAAQAQRGGAFEFLGVPVRVAPSLAGRHELKEEQAARKVLDDVPKAPPMKPQEFAELRTRALSRFQAIEAEPDKTAWRKAAPSHGLKGERPSDVLSPAARVKPPAPSEPMPQIAGGSGPIAKAVQALESAPKEADFQRATAAVKKGLLSEGSGPGGVSPPGAGMPSTELRRRTPEIEAPRPVYGARGWSPGSLASLGLPKAPAIGSTIARTAPTLMGLRASPVFPGATSSPPVSPPAIPGTTPVTPGLGPVAQPLWESPGSAPSGPAEAPRPESPEVPVSDGVSEVGGAGHVPPRPLGMGVPWARSDRTSAKPGGVPGGIPKPPQVPRLPRPSVPQTPVAEKAIPWPSKPLADRAPLWSGSLASGPRTSATPPELSLPQLSGGASIGRATTSVGKVPQRLLPNLSTLSSRPQATGLAIQRSPIGAGPSAASGGAGHGVASGRNQTANAPGGADTAQVHMLANEVWSLLKRRLLDEKNRMGRW